MPTYNVTRRRKRGQQNPFTGDWEYERLDYDELITHKLDIADELDGETISALAFEDTNGITLGTPTSSGFVITFTATAGGDAWSKLKVTKSGGDIVYIPIRWKSAWTSYNDSYRT